MDIFLIILACIVCTIIGSFLGSLFWTEFRSMMSFNIDCGWEGELLFEVVENSKNGTFICTPRGDIIYTNQSFCDMLGYTKSELLLMNWKELTPDKYIDADNFFLNQSLYGELNTFEIKKAYYKRNRKELPVDLQVSALRDSKNKVQFFLVNVQRDLVTPDNLVVNHRYFESAFDNSNIGMAILSTDGRWIRVNKRICEMTEYTADELYKKTFQDITHPDDLESDLDFVRKMITYDINTYTMEKRYITKSGKVIPIVLTVSGVYTEDTILSEFISQIELNVKRLDDEEYLK